MLRPYKSPLLNRIPSIQHGFFTREGGISEGIFHGLNVNARHDRQDHVIHNRQTIVDFLKGTTWIGLNQKHTNDVHFIDEDKAHAYTMPRSDDGSTTPVGDALVTASKGLVLSILTADCVPILLSNEKGTLIGAIHGGWKGILSGIIEKTIACMQDKGGSHLGALYAAVGPSIQQHVYEVGPEFQDYFHDYIKAYGRALDFSHFFKKHFHKNDHFLFDLPGLVVSILKEHDIYGVDHVALDTYSHETIFFSYRRRMGTGRAHGGCQGSCILIP